MNRRTRLPSLCLLALASSCQTQKSKPFVESAKFGIFYGGQVEERREIPFELDATKQTQGFRVDFGGPLARDADVEWRIQKPETPAVRRSHKLKRSDPKAPEELDTAPLEHAIVHAGERRFERAVAFEPGDPLGLWNVRVVASGKVVIDRAFEVYDPKERERLERQDAGR